MNATEWLHEVLEPRLKDVVHQLKDDPTEVCEHILGETSLMKIDDWFEVGSSDAKLCIEHVETGFMCSDCASIHYPMLHVDDRCEVCDAPVVGLHSGWPTLVELPEVQLRTSSVGAMISITGEAWFDAPRLCEWCHNELMNADSLD